MFVYSNYLYVNDWRCQVYEWYMYVIQKQCNVCTVYSSKGKQAGWVIYVHLLGHITLLSWRFACIQAFNINKNLRYCSRIPSSIEEWYSDILHFRLSLCFTLFYLVSSMLEFCTWNQSLLTPSNTSFVTSKAQKNFNARLTIHQHFFSVLFWLHFISHLAHCCIRSRRNTPVWSNDC